ncbi:hypothetical protein [Galbibacter sp. BG1]
MSDKTHWKTFFNYDYLGAYSLDEGKDLIVTIKHAKKEKVKGPGGKEEECLVCYFSDADKPMVLNRTNSGTIEKLYGTGYVEEWSGKKIQLYVKHGVKAFGQETDALRIRDFIPKVEKKTLTKSMKAWNRAERLMKDGSDIKVIKEHYTIPPNLENELLSLKPKS